MSRKWRELVRYRLQFKRFIWLWIKLLTKIKSGELICWINISCFELHCIPVSQVIYFGTIIVERLVTKNVLVKQILALILIYWFAFSVMLFETVMIWLRVLLNWEFLNFLYNLWKSGSLFGVNIDHLLEDVQKGSRVFLL